MRRPAALAVFALAILCFGPAAAQAAGRPQIGAAWVTSVTASSANLHAEVNPSGSPTFYRFQYLTEAAYSENLKASREAFAGAATVPAAGEAFLGTGTATLEASQHLSGLAAETTYRYRIIATNGEGTSDGEPHALATEELAPVFSLPDSRAWELVSPPEKNGGAVAEPGRLHGGGALQAAAGGEAATFSSAASFGEAAAGAPWASQYLARRVAGVGWQTENITAPTLSGAYGPEPDGVPYRIFSADLARGLLLNGARCAEGEECPRSYSLRESESGALSPSPEAPGLRFAGASPDLRHVVLATCAALTPDATEQPVCESGGPNLYEWSEGTLRLINRLGTDPLGTSDAHLAAQAGAISTDGQRIYFTLGEEAALYLREGEAGAKLVAEGSSFQTASSDGSIAYYTKEQGASGKHLYRYEAIGEHSADLTPSGGVVGVLGASEDGQTVYYQGTSGLEQWNQGSTTQIAPGAEVALASDYPPATGTARVSADGTRLAFLSTDSEALSGYDNTDAASGKPDSEVYLYEAQGAGSLRCISCDSTGERPRGPSTIPGALPNGSFAAYKPRALSADGTRLFFDSADALVPLDSNGATDVYQWEAAGVGSCAKPGGCLGLISSGKAAASFADASANGSDAFFLTEASLVGSDPGALDLYDAREGGGFPPPPVEPICEGDACQPVPPEPEDPSPGTLLPGSGNPPLAYPSLPCPKGRRRVVRQGKARCVAKRRAHRHGKRANRRRGGR